MSLIIQSPLRIQFHLYVLMQCSKMFNTSNIIYTYQQHSTWQSHRDVCVCVFVPIVPASYKRVIESLFVWTFICGRNCSFEIMNFRIKNLNCSPATELFAHIETPQSSFCVRVSNVLFSCIHIKYRYRYVCVCVCAYEHFVVIQTTSTSREHSCYLNKNVLEHKYKDYY